MRSATEAVAVPFFGGHHGPAPTDAGLTWEPLAAALQRPLPGPDGQRDGRRARRGGWVFGGDRNRILVADDGDLTPVSDDPDGAVAAARADARGRAQPLQPGDHPALPHRGGRRGAAHRPRSARSSGAHAGGPHPSRRRARGAVGRTRRRRALVAAGVYLARLVHADRRTGDGEAHAGEVSVGRHWNRTWPIRACPPIQDVPAPPGPVGTLHGDTVCLTGKLTVGCCVKKDIRFLPDQRMVSNSARTPGCSQRSRSCRPAAAKAAAMSSRFSEKWAHPS